MPAEDKRMDEASFQSSSPLYALGVTQIFARDGEKLFDLVQREQVALTVFGHDKQQWPTLKKAPAYYD